MTTSTSSRCFVVAAVISATLPTRASADASRDPAPGLGLSSETVHKVYGAGILGISSALLLEEVGAYDRDEVRYAVPGLALASGALLTIDPLLHGKAAPSNYAAETRQHMTLGGLLLATGGVDLAHEAGWVDHWSWGLWLPAGLLATSASFFFHAQHGDPSQHALMGAQHRILGATIAVAAVAKGLSIVPDETGNAARWPELRAAWMAAAGLAGIQLLLYTEGEPPAPGHGGHGSLRVGFDGRGVSLAGTF